MRERLRRVGVAKRRQLRRGVRLIQAIRPQRLRRRGLVGIAQQGLEVCVYAAPPGVERGAAGLPVRVVHGQGQARAVQRIGRHLVGLAVLQHLQAVLDTAQEGVGIKQFRHGGRRQLAALAQQAQHLADAPTAQLRLPPGADQLVHLADEFDLANAPGAKLDVVIEFLAPHLVDDQRLHAAQRIDGAKVQIAAKHERPQPCQQPLAGRDVAGHRARLDQRVALPVAAVGLVVVLHGIEGHRQRSAGAKRTQAHIDPEHAPVGVGFVQHADQPPRQAQEKFLVVERARPVAAASVLEGEHQVDIGREVQFVAAQLAHAQHHQRDRLALRVPRLANLLHLPAVQIRERAVDTGIGECRQRGERFVNICPSGQVAPGDAQHFALAQHPQRLPQGGFIGQAGERGLHRRPHGGRVLRRLQTPAVDQIRQQPGMRQAQIGHEFTRRQHPGRRLQPTAPGRMGGQFRLLQQIGKHPLRGFAQRRRQRAEGCVRLGRVNGHGCCV
nr:J420 [uncultured bacterium]